ncbi:MAG: hypothetical protein R2818_13000 [Flavobacteriales bacterium]
MAWSKLLNPEKLEYTEESLYELIKKVLRDQWTKDYRLEDFCGRDNCQAGPTKQGGTWSRPDIVVISISLLKFVPGKFLDIHTFEVKPYTGIDVTAVYMKRRTFAGFLRRPASFSMCPLEIRKAEWFQKRLDDIKEEANRHGIGFDTAEDVTDYET